MDSEDIIYVDEEDEEYDVIDEVTENEDSDGCDLLVHNSQLLGNSGTDRDLILEEGEYVSENTQQENNAGEEINLALEEGDRVSENTKQENKKEFSGEIELVYLKEGQGVKKKTEQTQNTGEEGSITKPPFSSQPTSEQVVDVENSSEVNNIVSQVLDVIELQNCQNEIDGKDEDNGKGICSSQNPSVEIKVESLESENYSQTASENCNKTVKNAISTETKQGNECERKVETIELKTVKEIIQGPSTDGSPGRPKESASWDFNVLLVRGLPPRHSGNLKQLLNTTLGVGCHRIKPRQKGDIALNVHFKSSEEMKIAHNLLHDQEFLGFKLIAKMTRRGPPKRKAEDIDEDDKPLVKKLKEKSSGLQFSSGVKKLKEKSSGLQFSSGASRDQVASCEKPKCKAEEVGEDDDPHTKRFQILIGPYIDQIAKKNEDIHSTLRVIEKLLNDRYPMYGGLIARRKQMHGGLICGLEKFLECPPNERFVTRCKFSIGIDEETGQLAVGFYAGEDGFVTKVSSVKHNYPPHVLEAVKVFEKAIRASEQAWEDPVGSCEYKFWHDLVVRTNQAQDLMFMVYVMCPKDLAADRMQRLNKELKEFFENGEGKNCRVTSLYTKVRYTTTFAPEQPQLVMGFPYLEETVLDLKFQLLPTTHFYYNIHSAKMLCKGVEELLRPKKKISVLEVGCSLVGLIGLYLSRVAGEVFCVDLKSITEEARKNAELNKITGCQYFSGKSQKLIPEVATKITYDKACAVVICSSKRKSTSVSAMEELRKIKQIHRMVVVTEMFKSRFCSIMALCNPNTSLNGMGNPFFPVRAIPVDTMPNGRGCVLIILMERIGLCSLPKTPHLPRNKFSVNQVVKSPGEFASGHKLAGHSKPYEKEARWTKMRKGDARLTINSRREEKEKRSFGASERCRFAGNVFEEAGSYRQNQMAGEFQRPYPDDGPRPLLDERCLRELSAEERGRRAEEEELKGWLEEDHRRKLEEDELKRRLEKEHRRKLEVVVLKRQMEEERERELVRLSSNLRTRDDIMQELIADSLREAAIPQLTMHTAQNLKQVIADAIKSVGVLNQESTSRGFSDTNPVSQFGRSEDQQIPMSKRFSEGYSRHVRELGGLTQREDDVYRGRYTRSTAGSDNLLKPQLGFYGRKDVDFGSAHSHALTSRESLGESSFDVQQPEGRDLYMRHMYRSDGATGQRQEQSSIMSRDSYTRHDNSSGMLNQDDYSRNERFTSRDVMPSFHSAAEGGAERYAGLRALNWKSLNPDTNYIPFSNTRRQVTCSTPKPPGTEDMYHQERGNSIYMKDPAQGAAMNSSLRMTLHSKDSSQDYRNRMQERQGAESRQDGMNFNRYFT